MWRGGEVVGSHLDCGLAIRAGQMHDTLVDFDTQQYSLAGEGIHQGAPIRRLLI